MISVLKELSLLGGSNEGAASTYVQSSAHGRRQEAVQPTVGIQKPPESTPGREGKVHHAYTNSEWEQSSDGRMVCAAWVQSLLGSGSCRPYLGGR